jgi:hypothetical protein
MSGIEAKPADRREPSHPARLLPTVTFGMRAAVLAGVVVAAIPAAANATPTITAGLSPSITQTISMYTTSCCGNNNHNR